MTGMLGCALNCPHGNSPSLMLIDCTLDAHFSLGPRCTLSTQCRLNGRIVTFCTGQSINAVTRPFQRMQNVTAFGLSPAQNTTLASSCSWTNFDNDWGRSPVFTCGPTWWRHQWVGKVFHDKLQGRPQVRKSKSLKGWNFKSAIFFCLV